MKEVMAFLAKNWVLGYSVSTGLCIIGYLVFSLMLVKSCRKIGYDVGVGGMVPVWNIIVLLKRIYKGRKLKPMAEDEVIEL